MEVCHSWRDQGKGRIEELNKGLRKVLHQDMNEGRSVKIADCVYVGGEDKETTEVEKENVTA